MRRWCCRNGSVRETCLGRVQWLQAVRQDRKNRRRCCQETYPIAAQACVAPPERFTAHRRQTWIRQLLHPTLLDTLRMIVSRAFSCRDFGRC
ncbi:hypothetical protein PHSY_005026 [Pseudozyma hubeiensis SY62]|uniref:Uncharacterized protein n=1 Tax=Pseudozyma hubeiensis (strain SY62) TaxID=1305764 RepID=R9PH76_PSEHS|nr:hypothetical protein PHSY_005026 [Pseudozyma hubeiensis SY62]GAC97440.1 hypothetical protein PHSY_005026 [Pseudozyma hubeiensis SY62]